MGIEDEEATVFLDQEKTEMEDIGKVLVEDEITSKQVTDKLTHKQKLIHSFIYFNAFAQLGVVTGMIGPLLWELASNTGTTIEKIGIIFAFRASGWMVGSLIAGRVFQKFNSSGNLILFISLFTSLSISATFPFVHKLWLLLCLNGVTGVIMSFIDVGGNTLILYIWKDKVGPYLQALHFSFGIGATVSPFIVGSLMKLLPGRALYSFWIVAGVGILSAVPGVLIKSPRTGDKADGEKEGKAQGRWAKIKSRVLTVCIGLLLFMYVGAETSYGGWLFTYAKEIYNIPDAEAAYMVSGFWGAITVGRLIAVPLSAKIKAKTMLIIDLIGSVLSLMMLIFFERFANRILLWCMTVLYGLFMASIFASAFSLPAEVKITLSSVGASLVIASASIGDTLLPMISGYIMKVLGPKSLMILIALMFIPLCATYVIIVFVIPRCCNRDYQRPTEQDDAGVELVSTNEEGE